jgi:hypothetical protein
MPLHGKTSTVVDAFGRGETLLPPWLLTSIPAEPGNLRRLKLFEELWRSVIAAEMHKCKVVNALSFIVYSLWRNPPQEGSCGIFSE